MTLHSPVVHTGPVPAGEIQVRTLLPLAALLLVTAVPAVLPPVTHRPLLHTLPPVPARELTSRADQVVGPVPRQDGLQTTDLVRLVLTVGDPVAPEAEADAGAVIAPELVPATAGWTVLLVVLTVPAAVTPLAEGDAGAVSAGELRAGAGRPAAQLVRAVPAVLPAVTPGEVGDAGPVSRAPELRPEAGWLGPAGPAVLDRDPPVGEALLQLQGALVGVGHSVLATQGAANTYLEGGRGQTDSPVVLSTDCRTPGSGRSW